MIKSISRPGKFEAYLNAIERILQSADLLKARERFPNRGLGAADFRGLNYIDTYRKYVSEVAYDFILIDQSLLIFFIDESDQKNGTASFSFLEAPVEVLSYDSFLLSMFATNNDAEQNKKIIDELGDSFTAEYEDYISSCPLRSGVCPIRYDRADDDYRQGIHPACHIHMGFENHSRIATRRILNPLSFLFFILRQRYPQAWLTLKRGKDYSIYKKEIRDKLKNVDAKYWCLDDEDELFLH